MQRSLSITLSASLLCGASAALASDRCNVPMAQWQPREALPQELEADRWKVTRIKNDDGCYEAYAIDEKGQRVEVSFDPKTFELVKFERKD